MALTLGELAARVGGEAVGDSQTRIERVAPIESAGGGDITFISNPKYVPFLRTTKAAAVIVSPQYRSLPRNLIVMANPYLGFAKAVEALMVEPLPRPVGIHPSAVVSPSAQIGSNVFIGPCAVIEDEARVGDGAVIMAGAHIGRRVSIGERAVIHPNVSLYQGVQVGKRCVIHSGVVIGSDGFGYAPDGRHYVPIPQVGLSIIGDDVHIGAASVINRGALGNTTIGNGTKIDSLVIISHNVEVGQDCLFVSQVGVSGSVKIGNNVTLGGQVGVAGHLTIGDNVQVAAQSGVSHSLEPNETYFGSPARPMRQMRRTVAAFNKLPELRDEIRHVQKRMQELSAILETDVKEAKRTRDSDKEREPVRAPGGAPAP